MVLLFAQPEFIMEFSRINTNFNSQIFYNMTYDDAPLPPAYGVPRLYAFENGNDELRFKHRLESENYGNCGKKDLSFTYNAGSRFPCGSRTPQKFNENLTRLYLQKTYIGFTFVYDMSSYLRIVIET